MTEIVQNRRAISDIEYHIFANVMPVFGSKFAVQIKCHSKTLDHFKERRWGGGHERLECTIKQIEIIKPQQKE